MAGLRLYLDENVDVRIAAGLALHGVEAISARDAGMLGATDAAQLAYAQGERAVLVTRDHHFLDLVADVARAGGQHHGLIYLPHRRLAIGAYVRLLSVCAQAFVSDEFVDRVEFL
ncbi:MAG: DUF5615 family PIN-like protein [bacterium]